MLQEVLEASLPWICANFNGKAVAHTEETQTVLEIGLHFSGKLTIVISQAKLLWHVEKMGTCDCALVQFRIRFFYIQLKCLTVERNDILELLKAIQFLVTVQQEGFYQWDLKDKVHTDASAVAAC